jgi:glycosyltransferase involved in cell wall biosynthesis/O-antigen ligase
VAVVLPSAVVAGVVVGVAGPPAVVLIVGALIALIVSARAPGVLFGLYLLIPFYKGALQPLIPFDITILLAIVNGLQVGPLLLDPRPRHVSRLGIGLWLAAGFLVLAGVLYAPDQPLALGRAVSYWALVVIPILPATLRIGSDARHLRHLLWTLAIAATLVVLLGIAQMSASIRLLVLGMNTIQVGRAALLVPLLGTTLLLADRRRWVRIAAVALMPPAFLVAIASGSRGPVFVLCAMALFVTIRTFVRAPAAAERRLAVLGGVAAVTAVVAAAVPGLLPDLSLDRFALFFDFVGGSVSGAGPAGDTSSSARMHLFGLALTMFQDRPLIGAGTAGFEALSPLYVGPVAADVYPHNALLQFAAEYGMVGVAVFSAVVIVALRRRLPTGPITASLVALSVFFLLNAMLSGNVVEDRMLWGLLALLLLIDAPSVPSALTPPALRSGASGGSGGHHTLAGAAAGSNRVRQSAMTSRAPIPSRKPTGSGRLRIGMVLYGDLTYDSRVRKEARTLAANGHDVLLVCLALHGSRADLPQSVEVLVKPIGNRSLLPGEANPFRTGGGRRLTSFVRKAGWLRSYVLNLRSWGRDVVNACGDVDAWHAHDLAALAAVAPNVASETPIVYDAHELYLETGTALRLPDVARALLRAYEKRLVARASAVITVNDEIADVIRRGQRPKRIEVVHNCPELWPVPDTRPKVIREAAGIPPNAPVVLYHGSLAANRGIDNLIEALSLPGLEDVHLALLGFGPMGEIYRTIGAEPRWRNRIHVLSPVAPSELLNWVASADVGAMPNPGSTLNDVFSSPNKLFECLAAGTPVVASDFPTMRRVVLDDPAGPLGALCDPSNPAAVAIALQSILRLDPEDMDALRSRCLEAARTRWNWEGEAAKLLSVYENIPPRASRAARSNPPARRHEPAARGRQDGGRSPATHRK